MDLSNLASILINIILPIVLVTLCGVLLSRKFGIEARPFSRAILYFFTPALVFTSAYRTQLNNEYFSIALFAIVITALMSVVTWVLIKIMRYDPVTGSAFALGVLFVNAGNYGLPLILFAYGQEGLTRATIYYTASAVLAQTLAIFIAARGRASVRDAVLNVFKLPLVYAVTVGLLLNAAKVVIPDPLMKSVDLLANAAVPVMLLILGIELSRVSFGQERAVIGFATFAKLVLTALVSFALASVMGLTGVARSVSIVESSMPTAVMASIVAVEFDAHPKLVSGIVFVSTVCSIVTLTILLAILR